MTQANKNQNLAIKTTDGPVLIIAGPGSGKTFTLVERIVYLITKKKVRPEAVMIATFTEKAAMELISRVSNRMLELGFNVNLNEMYIGTLHSIFLRILEENRHHTRLSRNYRILDNFDQKYFVYDNFRKFEKIPNASAIMGHHNQSGWDKSEELIKRISKVSEEALDVDKLLQSGNTDVIALAECYKLYSELLTEENSLDFSTIQTETLNLLQNNPKIKDELRKKINYILIDEYQDTNTVQEMILFQLMNPETKNICVVGDEQLALFRSG
jgi:DNA helicase II / ATP-dependent DNA helicase PcrA